MHLWLTYQAMAQDNSWALPQLTEKRNIYWNQDTQRMYNAEYVRNYQEAWLPPSVPAIADQIPQQHQVNFVNGDRIYAQPLATTTEFLPESEGFVVVLDIAV